MKLLILFCALLTDQTLVATSPPSPQGYQGWGKNPLFFVFPNLGSDTSRSDCLLGKCHLVKEFDSSHGQSALLNIYIEDFERFSSGNSYFQFQDYTNNYKQGNLTLYGYSGVIVSVYGSHFFKLPSLLSNISKEDNVYLEMYALAYFEGAKFIPNSNVKGVYVNTIDLEELWLKSLQSRLKLHKIDKPVSLLVHSEFEAEIIGPGCPYEILIRERCDGEPLQGGDMY